MNESVATAARTELRSGTSRNLVLALLVLSLAGTIATYWRVAVLSGQDQAVTSLLGEQQVLSQQIAKYAGEAADGQPDAFERLRRARDRFGDNLQTLRNGDSRASIPPLGLRFDDIATRMGQAWDQNERSATTIVGVMQPITTLFDSVPTFDAFAQELLLKTDELVNLMVETGASPDQVYKTTRNLMLLERISNNMRRTLQGGVGAVTAADRFGRDALLLSQILEGLLNGSERHALEPLADAEARDLLGALLRELEANRDLIDGILQASVELFQVQEASQVISGTSQVLLDTTQELAAAYQQHADNRLVTPLLGNLFAAVTLGLLGYLAVRTTGDARRAAVVAQSQAEEAIRREEEARKREEETRETNRRNQEAILRLLGEISDLADGDLTVNATVSEDFTGAIADAINYSVEEMRGLVANINRTAAQVAEAAGESRVTAMDLSAASARQTEQISAATSAIHSIASAFEEVSDSAHGASQVAERAVTIANKGAATVRDTITGMDAIREHIQETSKRIKRLGESSQEIGDIVGLIDDIADQTNILALNAAIQASMAGEAGRGFAVVADEVQRLAERSGQATRQIEALVKTIQSDTNDAVISMERSTTGVVDGARLAEGAGAALNEIEGVSNELAGLVRDISLAAHTRVGEVGDIARSMNAIREVTLQTTAGTESTALAIGNLADLAEALRRSVAGFKLPDHHAPNGDRPTADEPHRAVSPQMSGSSGAPEHQPG